MTANDLQAKLKRGTKPCDVIARSCIVVRLRMLNREVTGIYDRALRPLGVKVSQVNVLTAIAKLEPVVPGVIAELLRIEKSTLSRNVERMRASGWIQILSGDDDRSHQLEITPTGNRLLAKTLPLWKQAQKDAAGLLGKDLVQAVIAATDGIWAKAQISD